jgi:NADH-quinone oxidoreductase subunit F
MDLKHLDTEATPAERAAVDAVVPAGAPPRTWAALQRHRAWLLPALHALQDRTGHVSEGGLGYVCRRLHVAPAEAYGVATFYHLLAVGERPGPTVHACDDLSCRLAGAVVPDGAAPSPCLGLCDQAPAALVLAPGERPAAALLGSVTPADLADPAAATRARAGVPLHQPRAELHLLRRVGVVDPASFDDWVRHGGGGGLRAALARGPDAVIRDVTAAGLVGRGGAAFPTGRKWAAVAAERVFPHHLVCNADESEPGTFKDRVLMEEDPFSVIEGVALGAFAIGCARAVIYLRGEYPLARTRLEHAIAELRARGWLGADVLGTGVALDVSVFRGAGAYICGEETALLNSLEGLRGEPRQKPPFPFQQGLFREPTAVNNVETLCNVADILVQGPAAWAGRGAAGSPGTRLFCVSGKVERPGIYELGGGATLRSLLALAGGVPGGRPVRAVLLGGAAGTWVGPQHLDVPLTFDGVRAIGATLGSGVVLVIDDTVDPLDLLRRSARFFRDESCGQCVPCRVGTVRVAEWLDARAEGREAPAKNLDDLIAVLKDASICGLGQTAASAVESARRIGLLGGAA